MGTSGKLEMRKGAETRETKKRRGRRRRPTLQRNKNADMEGGSSRYFSVHRPLCRNGASIQGFLIVCVSVAAAAAYCRGRLTNSTPEVVDHLAWPSVSTMWCLTSPSCSCSSFGLLLVLVLPACPAWRCSLTAIETPRAESRPIVSALSLRPRDSNQPLARAQRTAIPDLIGEARRRYSGGVIISLVADRPSVVPD